MAPADTDAIGVRRLRAVDDAEVEFVCRLWRRSRESAMPEMEARVGHTAEQDLGFFRGTMLVEREIWIAVDGDADDRSARPVALLALEPATLENLYVDVGWQGRGIGKMLLDLAKALRPNGFTLYTFQANDGARRFYEREGLEALAFGVAPPPENEPDVQYGWRPPI